MARILGVDLPRNKEMRIALRSLYGVGPKLAKDILSQLEKTSDERLYFNLLNRYTDGDKLSDDERAFIKNFKK